MSGNCQKGFQSQRSTLKVIYVHMCECDYGGDIHFDDVTLGLAHNASINNCRWRALCSQVIHPAGRCPAVVCSPVSHHTLYLVEGFQ